MNKTPNIPKNIFKQHHENNKSKKIKQKQNHCFRIN